MEGVLSHPDSKIHIYTVSELTEDIRSLLEEQIGMVWVEGEISNFRAPSSGHYYMSIKDEGAQIRAVMFRPQVRYLRFMPEDGMKVVVHGRLSVYEPRGEYQLILDYMEPIGIGALALALEQLKKRLSDLGLFDPDKKRPLPRLPQKVAVITSPTGAAIRDFLKVIHRRFANIRVIVVPVRVQGEEATGEIVDALRFVNRNLNVDVIVITRGGGSIEDLWPFNQEEIAYAIRESNIPVVSAVGHEIDLTISDLAADLRAPTPSAAAEMLVMEKEALKGKIDDLKGRLLFAIERRLETQRDSLKNLNRALKDPRGIIEDWYLKVDDLRAKAERYLRDILKGKRSRLDLRYQKLLNRQPINLIEIKRHSIETIKKVIIQSISYNLRDRKEKIARLEIRLKDLDPFSVLRRGYSITFRIPDMKIFKDAEKFRLDDRVRIRLWKGELECRIEEIRSEESMK